MAKRSFSEKSKFRGVRRRLRRIKALVNPITDALPKEDPRGYIDFKLPIHCVLVEGKNAKFSVKKLCVQQLLLKCINLLNVRSSPSEARVIASISNPSMFGSRVTVFFDRVYFEGFFDRNGPEQKWEPLPESRSLIKEWNLSGFESLQKSEIGFREIIDDEDYRYVGEIWFYGDTSKVQCKTRMALAKLQNISDGDLASRSRPVL